MYSKPERWKNKYDEDVDFLTYRYVEHILDLEVDGTWENIHKYTRRLHSDHHAQPYQPELVQAWCSHYRQR